MTLLSRACVFQYTFIETVSVCRMVSEILSIKEWRDSETGGRGRSRSLKMVPFDRVQFIYDFLLVSHCKNSCSYLTLNNRIVTLKRSLMVNQTGTIRKLGCGFLFAFHSNYGHNFSYFGDIQC